ncbi:MAG: hypothetical protein ACLTGG_10315, partial [Subdoligranulum sp.]
LRQLRHGICRTSLAVSALGIMRYCLGFFVNVKPILFSLPYVVSIAKQAAQPRAAVFGAGGVLKAFLNRDIKAAPTAVLCTFPP